MYWGKTTATGCNPTAVSNNSIQFNLFMCKTYQPRGQYKVSTGKKMRRVRSKKVSENNVLIKIKI
jgi:hypothetical protein